MTWQFALDPLLYGVLGSVRVMMLLLAGPIFGHRALSPQLRVAVALLLTFAIGPSVAPGTDWRAWNSLEFAEVVVLEGGIGYLLGFAWNLVFGAFLALGQFAAHQGSLAAAHEIDPLSGVSTTALGTAFSTVGALVFFAIGGDHDLMRALALSFERFPIGGGGPDIGGLIAVGQLSSVIFEVGVRLAAPISVAIFLENIAIGILGRAMPQLNLLMVNLPIHVGIVLVIVGLGAPEMTNAFADLLRGWPAQVLAAVFGAG